MFESTASVSTIECPNPKKYFCIKLEREGKGRRGWEGGRERKGWRRGYGRSWKNCNF